MNQLHPISLILPTWNAAATIGAALDSAFGQTHPPREIIVVDDGSTDGTVQVLDPYRDRIRYVYQPNAGPSAARNQGIALATCELIAFLDADDLLPPDALATLHAELAQDPQLDIVQGQVRDFTNVNGELVFDEPRYGMNLGGALFRQTLWNELGGFDESMRLGEDIDFWMRTREQGVNRRAVPLVTYWYNRRAALGPDVVATHKAVLVRTLKRSLERTRAKTR